MLRVFTFGRLRLGCVVLVFVVMAGAVVGQERRPPWRPEKATGVAKRASSTPVAKPSPLPSPLPSPSPMVPVALVNPAPPEYMSGEANVTVKGNQNPTIRLGLAQNGVNVIEFPAADSFFMVHPGNSDLVSFDVETAKLSKRTLVLRPGAAFVAPPAGSTAKGPSTSISVQMQSGLVVTFLIYPVRELSQNAHRCVVMYNRDEVVGARKAAGLGVNLDGRDPAPKATGSIRLGGAEDENGGPIVPKVSRLIGDVDSSRADERVRNGKVSSKRPNLSEAANNALREMIRNPSRMGAFSKSSHGLGLAVAPVVDLDIKARIVVVAVRNDTQGMLRILPGNPELFVQTFDDNGKTLQLEQVKRLHLESTSLEGRLSKGEIAYYAIVYEAPVLGSMQRLRVAVSQMEAADRPATAAVGSAAGQWFEASIKGQLLKEYTMSAQANRSGNEFRGDQRLVIEETEEQIDPELQEVVSDERRAELVDEGNIVAEVERERGENQSKGRGRKAAAAVVFLFVISAAAIGAWYVIKSGGKRQAKVPVNRSSSASVAESEEALTKQAIEQANGAGPGITLSDGSVIRPSMPSSSPAARPADSNIPVTQLPTKSNEEELSGTVDSSEPTPSETEEKQERVRPAASGRNDERSVRIGEDAKAEPNGPSEREAAVAEVIDGGDGGGDAVPGFGSKLPVRTLGVLYTLRSGGLARFELTQDVNGNGWSMPRGTVLIGALRGGEFDRAFVSLVGFIDTESGRFVKISGELHGSDGAPGISGKRKRMTSGWSRALSKLGDAGLGIAGAFAGSIGRRPIVFTDAVGTSTGRVTSELDGVLVGRDRDSFVEVAAGSSGYMIVTEPEKRSNLDQPSKSTGISESELAELVQSGNRRRIREAMPRMTPEMRRIAEAVLNGDFAAR